MLHIYPMCGIFYLPSIGTGTRHPLALLCTLITSKTLRLSKHFLSMNIRLWAEIVYSLNKDSVNYLNAFYKSISCSHHDRNLLF